MKMIGLFLLAAWCSGAPVEFDMWSPNENVTGTVRVDDDGVLMYSVKLGTEIVIPFSRFGFELATGEYPANSLYDHFLKPIFPHRFNPRLEWSPIVGEQKIIADHYNQLMLRLTQAIPSAGISRLVQLNLRAYDIGVAVQLQFFELDEDLVIGDEVTEFRVLGDHRAWWAPADYDAQDYNFVESKLSDISQLIDTAVDSDATLAAGTPIDGPTVQTPVTLRTTDGIYISIHEAGGDVFPSMNLEYDAQTLTFKAHLTPDLRLRPATPEGEHQRQEDLQQQLLQQRQGKLNSAATVAATVPAADSRAAAAAASGVIRPFGVTPWRAVMVTRDSAAILSNYMIYNLNEQPAESSMYEYVAGRKSVGVWWEMVKGEKTWRYTDDVSEVEIGSTDYSKLSGNGRHGATTERVVEFIDFASKYQFDAVTFEGWNEGWEQATRDDKDILFDHLKSYPDLNETAVVAAAAAAADGRRVDLIKHHPVGAAIGDFKAHASEALIKASELGYKSIKVSYDGGLFRDGTHRSSQATNEHYRSLISEASKQNLCISIHGGLKPTGLSRTYPNLLSSTVQRTNAHSLLGLSPKHATILPWNHLIGSPIEYGAGVLSGLGSNDTLIKQIALLLVLYSPNQLVAETAETLEAHGELLKLISKIPSTWNRSVYLEAEIGKYVTVARNEFEGGDWYIAGISSTDSRKMSVPLSFLDDSSVYSATIYEDDGSTYKVTSATVFEKDALKLVIGNHGGFVAHLVKSGSLDNECAEAD